MKRITGIALIIAPSRTRLPFTVILVNIKTITKDNKLPDVVIILVTEGFWSAK